MKPIQIASFIFVPIVVFLVIDKKLPQYSLPLFGAYVAIAMTVEENYAKNNKR